MFSKRAEAQSFPINSDVAIQPAEDQFIYRTQLRYRPFDQDEPKTDVKTWIQSSIFVYGWNERFLTVLGVPLLYGDFETELPIGGALDESNTGVGDITLLFRYLLWKKLGYLESQTWTALAGVQIPSYDELFSSRSWDPIAGTVYSWRVDRLGFDADVIYQLNTENDRDLKEGDVLRYDLAYQYRLCPSQYTSETEWSLTGLLELNGEYQWENELDGSRLAETDGQQIFLSPGVVLAGKRVKYETGLPVSDLPGCRRPSRQGQCAFRAGFYD